MELSPHLIGILGISTGFWILYFLIRSIQIRNFIVRRYEQETKLLETVFFKEHVTFAQYLPSIASSVIYKAHLLMCEWGWRVYGNKKAFRDIESPEAVTSQFSEKELRSVKRQAIHAIIVLFHLALFSIYLVVEQFYRGSS